MQLIGFDVHGVRILVVDIDAFIFSEAHNFIHYALRHLKNRNTEDYIIKLKGLLLSEFEEIGIFIDFGYLAYLMIAVANEEIILVPLNELKERFNGLLDALAIGAIHDKLNDFLGWVGGLLVLVTEVVKLLNHLLDAIVTIALHDITITECKFDVLEGDEVLKGYHINDHRDAFVAVGLLIEVLIALND